MHSQQKKSVASTISLRRLVRPASVGAFLHRGGRQKLQVSHGPLSRFPELAEIPELFDLRHLVAVYREPIAVWFPDSWVRARRLRSGYGIFFEPISALQLWRMGATLLFHYVHRYVPKVRALVSRIERDLGIRGAYLPSAFNLFASGPGASARLHFDPELNFAIHLQGTKRWWMTENRVLENPRGSAFVGGDVVDPAVAKLLRRKSRSEWYGKTTVVDMRPGSTMYFPPGCWHRTSSVEPSMHAVIAVYPHSWADVVVAKVERKLPLDLALSRREREGWSRRVSGLARTLRSEELLSP